jgi:hypothetical protein
LNWHNGMLAAEKFAYRDPVDKRWRLKPRAKKPRK